jgi:hypothetical protein
MAKIIYFIRQGETHPVDAESPTPQSGLPVVNKTLNRIRRVLNHSPEATIRLTGTRKEGLSSLFTPLLQPHDEQVFQWRCA